MNVWGVAERKLDDFREFACCPKPQNAAPSLAPWISAASKLFSDVKQSDVECWIACYLTFFLENEASLSEVPTQEMVMPNL